MKRVIEATRKGAWELGIQHKRIIIISTSQFRLRRYHEDSKELRAENPRFKLFKKL